MNNKSFPYIFGEEYVKLSNELNELNEKYNIDENNLKMRKEISKKMNQIITEYDSNNIIEPCPRCGGERKASIDGICVNVGNCDFAPKIL